VNPKVTFIIPCYKLAHLLPECIDSILQQTYRDFEVLILDDCSPDNTAEVARSFTDPRVHSIRNESNLGHLHNYNKGIAMARGEYVWLISADDRLRKPYALERYVRVMDEHPSVGYAFCPAIGLLNDREQGVEGYSVQGTRDAVWNGRQFLKRLVYGNSVPAASGLVRRKCYEQVSVFPLDLPFAGDWYLWCIFALHFDVAYFAEPLVNYRSHELSMTNRLTYDEHLADEIAVRWRIKRLAQEAGFPAVVKHCLRSAANLYGRCVVSARFHPGERCLSITQVESSLQREASDVHEAGIVRAKFYARVGDGFYAHRAFADALRYYGMALQTSAWLPDVWVKTVLLRLGPAGLWFRDLMRGSRSPSIGAHSEVSAHSELQSEKQFVK
jgi:glycosyltransferase involved in cell wall biosynthesis